MAGMQDDGIKATQRLPLRFKGKTWEDRQHVAGLESFEVAPERAMHGTVNVNLKLDEDPWL